MQTYRKAYGNLRRPYFVKLLTAKLCIVKVQRYVVLVTFCFSGISTVISVPSRKWNIKRLSVNTVTDSTIEFQRLTSKVSSTSPHCLNSSRQRRTCSFWADCARISSLRRAISSSAFLHSASSSEKWRCIPAGLGSAGYSPPCNAGGCLVARHGFLLLLPIAFLDRWHRLALAAIFQVG